MKKILTLVAFMGTFIMGARAQNQAYVQTVISVDSMSYATACDSTDSAYISYAFINVGSYTIQTSDTFAFTDPSVPDGYANIGYVTAPVPTNDTIYSASGYLSLAALQVLYASDGNGGLVSVDGPFTSSSSNALYLGLVDFEGFVKDSANYLVNSTSTVLGDSIIVGADTLYPYNFTLVDINCSGTTGINNLNKNNLSLNVYPNPASDVVKFTTTFAKASKVDVRIMDITGRVVNTVNLGNVTAGSQTFSIDVSGLTNGSYMLEFTTDDSRGIAKFTKD